MPVRVYVKQIRRWLANTSPRKTVIYSEKVSGVTYSSKRGDYHCKDVRSIMSHHFVRECMYSRKMSPYCQNYHEQWRYRSRIALPLGYVVASGQANYPTNFVLLMASITWRADFDDKKSSSTGTHAVRKRLWRIWVNIARPSLRMRRSSADAASRKRLIDLSYYWQSTPIIQIHLSNFEARLSFLIMKVRLRWKVVSEWVGFGNLKKVLRVRSRQIPTEKG